MQFLNKVLHTNQNVLRNINNTDNNTAQIFTVRCEFLPSTLSQNVPIGRRFWMSTIDAFEALPTQAHALHLGCMLKPDFGELEHAQA